MPSFIRCVGTQRTPPPGLERAETVLTRVARSAATRRLETWDVGYYRVPRQATHQDIAEDLDRSDGTVGEHLRKIEAQVMAAIAP